MGEEMQRGKVCFMKKYLAIIWSFIIMSSIIWRAVAQDAPMILTKEESSPLIWAVYQNDKDAVLRLVNNKDCIDFNQTDKFNRTALFLAVVSHEKEIVTLLADAGADLNKRCGHETALHAAVGIDEPEIVKILLEKGANIESTNGDGRTALHEATFRNEIVELLLKKGANVEARDKQGRTPLHLYSEGRGNIDTLTFLLNAGADIHAIDSQGRTPLHYAADTVVNNNSQLDKIKLLINYGADPNAIDKEGKKPLDLAKAVFDTITQKHEQELGKYSKAIVNYLSSSTKR